MNKKKKEVKKVLIVCSIYRPHVGGVETSTEELAAQYKKRGIKTVVLTKRFPRDLDEYEIINDVEIIRVLPPKNKIDYKNVVSILKKYQNILISDIVHVIGVRRPLPFISLLLSRIWNVPFVVTYSGGDIPDSGDSETKILWEEGKHIIPDSLKQADWQVAFSKSIARQVKNAIPVIKNIDIIYGGINLQYIQAIKPFNTEDRYIVSARRLLHSKGIDILIKSFSRISSEFPNLKLYIIGDGPELNSLINLTKKLYIENKVIFTGNQSYDKMIAYLKSSIAHICPSRGEGGGLINFEAQASGTVAIGSDVGGIIEYIDDKKTGLIFKSEDETQLYKVLFSVLTDSLLRNMILNTVSKKIKSHDWSVVAQNYLTGYEKLIQKSEFKTFKPWSELSKNVWNLFTNKLNY